MANRKQNESVFCFAELDEKDVAESLKDVDVDNLPADALIPVNIPIFREGKFEHAYYGDLDFTPEYLAKLVDNYNRGVVPRSIAFDEDHRRFTGAAIGWIRDDVDDPVYVAKKEVPSPDGKPRKMSVLYARVNLNRHGAQLVKSHAYRYFSSEIHPNFSTHEKITMTEAQKRDAKRKGKDTAVISHGPTLLGGGLTNNPFIPGLGEFELSNDATPHESDNGDTVITAFDDDGSRMHLFSYNFSDTDDQFFTEPEGDEPEDIPTTNPAPVEEPTQQTFDGDKPMLKELLEKLSKAQTNAEKIQILDQNAQAYSGDEVAAAAIAGIRAATESAIEMERSFNTVVAESQRQKERVEKLNTENASLRIEAASAKEIAFSQKVELFSEQLLKDGHYAAVVNKAAEVLRNSPVETRTAKYSFDADATEEVSLLEVLKAVISALPAEARMDYSENLTPNPSTEGDEIVPPVAPAPKVEEPAADALPAKVVKFSELNEGQVPHESLFEHIDENGEMHPFPVAAE